MKKITEIKFSDLDLKVLNNFIKINKNLLIKKNTNKITTINPAKNIYAEYFSSTFNSKVDLCFYDFNEFLYFYFQIPNPKIIEVYSDKKEISTNQFREVFIIKIKNKDYEFNYELSEKNILIVPEKDCFSTLEYFYSFKISKQVTEKIFSNKDKKLFSRYKFFIENGDLKFQKCNENLRDLKNFKYCLNKKSNQNFIAEFSTEYINIFFSDYEVSVSNQYVIKLKNNHINLNYLIALEKNSKFENN